MSASKKKKLRQNAEPSAQQLLEQQKAAAYHKKVRTYTVIGIVVAILVAVLLIWNSGLFQRGQTAVVVGDTKYSVNDVNYFYQTARYNAFYLYTYLGYDTPSDSDVMDADTGETYREYFLDSALQSLVEVTALYDKAVADGYKDSDVADEVAEQITATKEYASTSGYSYATFLKLQYGSYMTPAAFKSILTRSTVVDVYYTACADAIEYTDEEYQTYYEANTDTLDTYDFSVLLFTAPEVTADESVDEDTLAQLEADALAAAKADADAALAALQSGIDMADVAAAYESAEYTEHSTAMGSSLSSVYGDELKELTVGDAVLVESGSSYYVVTLHQRGADEEGSWKESAYTSMQSEELSAWLEELCQSYTGELTAAAKYVAN